MRPPSIQGFAFNQETFALVDLTLPPAFGRPPEEGGPASGASGSVGTEDLIYSNGTTSTGSSTTTRPRPPARLLLGDHHYLLQIQDQAAESSGVPSTIAAVVLQRPGDATSSSSSTAASVATTSTATTSDAGSPPVQLGSLVLQVQSLPAGRGTSLAGTGTLQLDSGTWNLFLRFPEPPMGSRRGGQGDSIED